LALAKAGPAARHGPEQDNPSGCTDLDVIEAAGQGLDIRLR
jgi:hypothetical protein